MRTVYLHMGTPKTGTTSLQEFLYNNRHNLEKKGILYPSIIGEKYLFGNAQHLFIIENDDKKRAEKICEAIGNCKNDCLLSAEASWVLISNLSIFFDTFYKNNFKIKVIVYLRPQVDYFDSFYKQYVKLEPCTYLEINDFMQTNEWEYIRKLRDSCHYYHKLKEISDIIGKENLFIRVYEKSQMNGSIFEDFLNTLNIEMDNEFLIPEKYRNVSLDCNMLELKRLINSADKTKGRNRIERINSLFWEDIESMIEERPISKSDLHFCCMTNEQRTAFMVDFAEENRLIAHEFLNRESGELFFENKNKSSEQKVDDGLLLRNLIECYAKTSIRLKNELIIMEKKIDSVEEEMNRKHIEFEKRLRDKQMEINIMKNSYNWKVTEPLKRVKCFLKRKYWGG